MAARPDIDRAALVRDNVTLARRIAAGFCRINSHLSIDDATQEACIGLIQAAERWDETTGVPFAAFAASRVRGSVQDYVRRLMGGRGVAPPVSVELPQHLASQARSPADVAADRVDAARALTAPLTDQQRRVLVRHYIDGLTFDAIAAEMGVSMPRVWQVEQDARRVLREWLR